MASHSHLQKRLHVDDSVESPYAAAQPQAPPLFPAQRAVVFQGRELRSDDLDVKALLEALLEEVLERLAVHPLVPPAAHRRVHMK